MPISEIWIWSNAILYFCVMPVLLSILSTCVNPLRPCVRMQPAFVHALRPGVRMPSFCSCPMSEVYFALQQCRKASTVSTLCQNRPCVRTQPALSFCSCHQWKWNWSNAIVYFSVMPWFCSHHQWRSIWGSTMLLPWPAKPKICSNTFWLQSHDVFLATVMVIMQQCCHAHQWKWLWSNAIWHLCVMPA